MLAIMTAAALLAHVPEPNYRPKGDGLVVACQDGSLLPIVRALEISDPSGAWTQQLEKAGGCVPLLTPVFVDFFEDVHWRGSMDQVKILRGIRRLARVRIEADGADLFVYAIPEELEPIGNVP